jgi:hypothetical protein
MWSNTNGESRATLDPDFSDADLRSAIFNVVQREQLQSALGQVVSLVRPPEDMYYLELQQAGPCTE